MGRSSTIQTLSCHTDYRGLAKANPKQSPRRNVIKTLLSLLVIFIGLGWITWEIEAKAETIRLVQYEALPLAAQNLPEGGFACRVTIKAFALHNHKVTIQWFPPKRALWAVQSDIADISLGWRKTPEREKTVIFSDLPLLDASIQFYHHKDRSFDWNRIEDLKGLRIGYTIGSISVSEEFLEAEKSGEITVERVTSEEQNIKKLLSKRIDIMVGSPLSVPFLLKTKFSAEEERLIAAHPKLLFEARYFAVFSKKLAPHLIKAFNDGIRELHKSGQYQQWLSEALQHK